MRSIWRSSARSWLTTTAPPFQPASTWAISARASASRLLVGSSSSSRSGSRASRPASAARVAAAAELGGQTPRFEARQADLGEGRLQSRGQGPVGVVEVVFCALAGLDAAQARKVAGQPEDVGDARARRRRQGWRSTPTRPRTTTDPAAGEISPSISRISVVLPTPLRPTRPVRSAPKARVRSSKSGWPSGVLYERLSSVRKADMENRGQRGVRDEVGVRRDVHGAAVSLR